MHSWHLYYVRLTNDARYNRDELIDLLNKDGIKCSVHFIPLHRLKYWREEYDLEKENYPISENAYNSCLSLPHFTKMTEQQIEQVANALKKHLGSNA